MDYKQALRLHFEKETTIDQKKIIDFATLIETIVTLYGNDSLVDIWGPYVTASSSGFHLSEDRIEKILDEVLTEDGKNMGYFIVNTPEAKEKLKWEYNIQEGECYISAVTQQ